MTVVDAAWGSLTGLDKESTNRLPLEADIVITSPHKKGLSPSPLGAFLSSKEDIVVIYDEALKLGFASTSISYLQLSAFDYSLERISLTDIPALLHRVGDLRTQLEESIFELAPSVEVISAANVHADLQDNAHVLLKLPNTLSGHDLTHFLSSHHYIHCEKSTKQTILLLLSPHLLPADVRRLASSIASGVDALSGGQP